MRQRSKPQLHCKPQPAGHGAETALVTLFFGGATAGTVVSGACLGQCREFYDIAAA
jgi:hypothetical protein